MMFNSRIKNTIFFIFCVVLLFGLSLGIGMLIRSLVRKPEELVNERDVVLIADTDTIFLNNRLGVSDEFGSKISDSNGGTFVYYEFSLANHSDVDHNYEIYLTQVFDEDVSFNTSYLKMYLTTSNNFGLNTTSIESIPSFNNLPYLFDKPGSKLLYSGSLSKNCTTNMILRVWVAENYIPPVEEGTVKYEVHVRAI